MQGDSTAPGGYTLRPLYDGRWMRSGTKVDRFWPHVAIGEPDECWPWVGYVASDGRGRVGYGKRPIMAYRVAYELTVGPIPSGYHVHHRCENGLCCNPAHLEALAPGEHVKVHHPNCETCPDCGSERERLLRKGGQTSWTCRPCDAERKRREREAQTADQVSERRARDRERKRRVKAARQLREAA